MAHEDSNYQPTPYQTETRGINQEIDVSHSVFIRACFKTIFLLPYTRRMLNITDDPRVIMRVENRASGDIFFPGVYPDVVPSSRFPPRIP